MANKRKSGSTARQSTKAARKKATTRGGAEALRRPLSPAGRLRRLELFAGRTSEWMAGMYEWAIFVHEELVDRLADPPPKPPTWDKPPRPGQDD